MNVLTEKLKEVLISVLPITLLVIIISFTLVPLEINMILRFILGAIFIIIGLTLFFIGVDIGITPLGNMTGESLTKSNKATIVVLGALILGFFISIAEPGLLVLANQVDSVTAGQISSTSILLVVSIGLAILLAVAFIRVIYGIKLRTLLVLTYIFIFILAFFTSDEFLAISFDASGATTGVLAVPFILALSSGISKLNKNSRKSEEDSFGMLAMASAGAIIGVMLLDMFVETKEYDSELVLSQVDNSSVFMPFIKGLFSVLLEAAMSLLPIFVILIIMQFFVFKLNRKSFRKLVTGVIFTFIGLVLFLSGVNNGFMDVGTIIGSQLVKADSKIYLIIVAFILGVVTILAEPAVYVQTQQIEDVTVGYVKKTAVLVPLALGVGTAVMLSVIRIITPGLELMHILIPGYIIALGLTYFVPQLFVGIAFDAGGVATGPMTATFTLAFVQGVASNQSGADLLRDGFGMIALVAMFPIITLQLLGWIFKIKSDKQKVKEGLN